MKQSLRYIGLLAILPLAMIALSPDLILDASAQKVEGNTGSISVKSSGSSNDDVICYDHPCSIVEESPEPRNIYRTQ